MTRDNKGMRSTLAIIVVTVLAATSILALSALFAQSDQVARVANRGKVLHAADELFSATTAERGATAVALLMAEAFHRGYATESQLKVAIHDMVASAEEVLSRGIRLDEAIGASSQEFGLLAKDAADAGLSIGRLLEDGEREAAGSATPELLGTLGTLEAELSRQRTDAYSLLIAEEGSAGRIVRATSIAVAFLIPGAALVLFRWLQSRRQRRVELELQLAHERAQGRIKDQMIANLSHELRTPLTGIYGTALSMQEQGSSDPDFHAEMTGIIVRESADLSRMVDDLLVAAKADSGDLAFPIADVDVQREVAEAILPFRGLDREISVDCAAAVVGADRLRLRQVVRNLVSNAVKHGGSGIAITGERNGDRYLISVTDDGPGVSPEAEGALFERYVHSGDTPLTRGSIGLGLAVARLLARGMSGDLRHVREDGLTSFVLELPLSTPAGIDRTAPVVSTTKGS